MRDTRKYPPAFWANPGDIMSCQFFNRSGRARKSPYPALRKGLRWSLVLRDSGCCPSLSSTSQKPRAMSKAGGEMPPPHWGLVRNAQGRAWGWGGRSGFWHLGLLPGETAFLCCLFCGIPLGTAQSYRENPVMHRKGMKSSTKGRGKRNRERKRINYI